MAFGALELNPGVDTMHSPAQLRHGWSACNLVRFRDGFPEKRGGWQQLCSTPFIGTSLGMHAWADLSGNAYLAAGTEQRAQVYSAGSIYDITPVRLTSNAAPDFSTTLGSPVVTIKVTGSLEPPGDWLYLATQVSVGGLVLYGYYQCSAIIDHGVFTIKAASPALLTVNDGGQLPTFTTTAGSAVVTVVLENHGLSVGNPYPIDVATSVGGLSLFGTQTVASVIDANTLTFAWGIPAGFNDTESENGGKAQFLFLLSSGLATNRLVGGYGAGTFGSGIFGVANTATVPGTLRSWFWDNWGEDGIGNYWQGPLYLWQPLVTGSQRATIITNAPAQVGSSFVAMPSRIVVALGSTTAGVFDPSLISWCDSDDYTDWTPTVSNQAGSFRLPTGSRNVGGLQAPLQGLVWTDVDLYVMQYIALPYVFGFNKIADGCGLIAPRAAGMIAGTVMWMGPQGFFVYAGGSVQPLDCPVWRTIYRNMNMGQLEQIHCAVNVAFNEIEWRYPSATSGTVDSYVTCNILDGTWTYGSIAESAWVGQSVLGTPVGADYQGLLQQHEVGYSANGADMNSFIASGLSDISNGHDFVFADQVIPDMIDTPSQTQGLPQLTLASYRTPNDPSPKSYGPYAIDPSVQYVSTRLRGRLAQFTISDSSSGFWRLGLIRYRYASDGSR